MEVPRLGVESELQLLARTTVTATQDPSHVCNLHHNSWQHWILNPLSEARDQTRVFMDTSLGLLPLSHNGNSCFSFYLRSSILCRSWKKHPLWVRLLGFESRHSHLTSFVTLDKLVSMCLGFSICKMETNDSTCLAEMLWGLKNGVPCEVLVTVLGT